MLLNINYTKTTFRIFDKSLIFTFLKSEFFFFNVLKKKAFIRKKLSTSILIDTFYGLFLFSKLVGIRRKNLFFLAHQFFFIFSFCGKKHIKFLDVLQFQNYNYKDSHSVLRYFCYPIFFLIKDIWILKRISGGYFCFISGKFCFFSFSEFYLFQTNSLNLTFVLFTFVSLKVIRRRKIRKNFLKYKKLIRNKIRFLKQIKNIENDISNLHFIFLIPKTFSYWQFFNVFESMESVPVEFVPNFLTDI